MFDVRIYSGAREAMSFVSRVTQRAPGRRVPHQLGPERHLLAAQGPDICTECCVVRTGFSHCTKMVPVKSHNDFSRPLVEKGVV